MDWFCYKVLIKFIFFTFCFAFPLDTNQENEVFHPPMIGTLGHKISSNEISFSRNSVIPHDDESVYMEDIRRLQELDELLGLVEEAAMSDKSFSINEELSELEEKLKKFDSVQLLEEDEHLAEVVDDLGNDPQNDFSVVALPYQFREYDVNGDGLVTPLELARSTGTKLEDAMEPFEQADENGDRLLTKDEFLNAPWVFDKIRRHH